MGTGKAKLSQETLEPLIFSIRGSRVMLDADLARLYGVTTKRFNEAFKRSRQRFPEDFAFRLSGAEFANLRSQIATSSSQPSDCAAQIEGGSQFVTSNAQVAGFKEETPNWSQFAASSHGGRRYRPWVFTEHGALMVANVLRSDHAVQMSVFVIRAFVRMREEIAANTAILKRLAEIDKALLQHDSALRDLYSKLLPLLQPPPAPPKRRIGFIVDDE